MAKAKHRRQKRLNAPRVLLTLLLVYGAAAVLTFASIRPSPIVPPTAIPDASLDNMTMNMEKDAVDPTSTQTPVTAPLHTEPTNPVRPMADVFRLPDTTTVTTQSTGAAPTTKSVPVTTKPTPTTTTTPTPKKTVPNATVSVPATTSSSFRAKFFAAAQAYLGRGIPYLYGGKTLSALDCSGFVWTVLKSLSPSQPYRSSSVLKSWATNISMSQAMPGDLVFWPGHVAVYAGNGTVINQGGPGPGPILIKLWPGYSFGRIPL